MFLINSFYFKILSAATFSVRKSLRRRFRTVALKGENLKEHHVERKKQNHLLINPDRLNLSGGL